MLRWPKQLARAAGLVIPMARASCFGKRSMTFFFSILSASFYFRDE
jgi:hypothetical protein